MYRWEGKKMYTLLIADDEPLIRNGVKKIIDWESLGFSEIFLAEDGRRHWISYGKIMWILC